VPDGLAGIPDATPTDEPFHRFANRPYTVFGQTYVPVVNKEPRKERGLASWYGRKFHGQKTSSGEIYDMFAMTAAHKTLPIPSYARVTNVKTGLSVVVA
jgi:rare lipoprotein A